MHSLRWTIVGAVLASACWLAAMSMQRTHAQPADRQQAQQPVGQHWIPQPAEIPDDGKLRIIAFGAHPDDAEINVGGTAHLWAKQGHHVKFVSMTNGDIGHWGMAGGALAQRRIAEVEAAAEALGIAEVEVLDIHDGELMPTLENRRTVVRLIREWGADIVLSHRPNDYHPDHRNTGLLVRDAGYMVTVPYFCPDVPYLENNPIFLHYQDRFTRPNPFRPDVVVDTSEAAPAMRAALHAMESQVVEGGCCRPERRTEFTDEEREAAVDRWQSRFRRYADQYREQLIEHYGEAGRRVEHAEAFELGEYGRRPPLEELRAMFPGGG